MAKRGIITPKKLTIVATLILLLVTSYRYFSQKTPVEPRSQDRVVVVALGDSGTGGEAQKKVAAAIEEVCEGYSCDAAFLLGDVIYDKGVTSPNDEQFRTKFEIPYEAVDIPFYIALGNHDSLGCRECYIEYGQRSSKWIFPSYYYRKSFGQLLDVFVLDTENFDQNQAKWLRKELDSSTADWKIAIGHHPIYTNSTEYNEAYPEKKALLAASVCSNFDFYLSGHSHGLEYLGNKCGLEHLVAGGGGANLYEILPNQDPFSAESYGFLLLEIQKNLVSFHFYNQEERLLYSHQTPR